MAAAANPLNEKVQNLPLVCVDTILKFTPTTKLVRLCSIAVPLPGAFWNLGLETALKKRLPLSLLDDCQRGCRVNSNNKAKAVFDITGAKIAAIKNPEMFRFCPIREFIESANLRIDGERRSPSHVVHGDAMLAHLPNIRHLALVVHRRPGCSAEAKDLFEPLVKRLLPQLQSFELSVAHFFFTLPTFTSFSQQVADELFVNVINEAHIDEMNCLQRLVLPEAAFDGLSRASPNSSARLQAVLAGLSSFGIGHNAYCKAPYIKPAELNFVSVSFKQLSQLQVVVRDKFAAYLATFSALQALTSLRLDLESVDLTGLVFEESNMITSVSDLRISLMRICYRMSLYVICLFEMVVAGPSPTIAAIFPNVKTLALRASANPDLLELANSIFGETQFFPALAKLAGFDNSSATTVGCSSEILTQFLANPHLPKAVDFSQIIFANLTRDANLLTAIYCAMQASSIKRLLLRGPVHHEALARLQSHTDFCGEMAKVSAWKDRDLGDQPGLLNLTTEISQQTDFQIVGLKTSGNLKNERFTIRVFHQLAKRVDIFGRLSAVD